MRFAERVSPVTIREHEELREAASIGQSIQDFAPGSEAALDFVALADWLLGHEQTDIAAERAKRLRETPAAENTATEPIPSPETKASLPEALQEPKPVVAMPSPASSRVADVLHRVRSSDPTGTRQGFSLELDRIPKGAFEAAKRPAFTRQTLELDPESSRSTTENDSTLRYGVQQTPDGVLFRQPTAGANAMAITGDFNDWHPEGLSLVRDNEQRCFEVTLSLEPGRYEYQLLVDGEAGPDPFGVEKPGLSTAPIEACFEVVAPT